MDNTRITRAIASAHADPSHELRLLETADAYPTDAILITETETADGPRIIYANEAFERMSGYSAAEVYGKTPRLLQGPSTSREASAMIHEALTAWRPITIELLNYSRDGHTFWVELSIVPVPNDSGCFTHWVSIQRNVSDRHSAEVLAKLSREVGKRERIAERLAYSSSHDTLSGLANRSSFLEHVTKKLAETRVGIVTPFALLYLDLDRLRIVNESLGHAVGDALLRRLAARFQTCIGFGDLLARMGGDEFAVFLDSSSDPRYARDLARRMLEVLREPVAIDAASIVIKASFGIVGDICDGNAPEDILRDAGIAMYRAKKCGGDRFVLFDDTMRHEALATYRLHHDLQRAIVQNEFIVYYQPLVRLATGEVYGFEALVRWLHPERGIVSPLEFIAVAEETHAIVPIGTSVLRQACAAWQTWPACSSDGKPLKLSVNVSCVQLLEDGFVEMLTATVREFGLPRSVLQIEVTESVLIGDTAATNAMLNVIREAGIRVALDDFGTGYSSLSYLERFPFDGLKIDRSFVSSLADGHRNLDVLRTIVELANVFDMEVVAEGVETSAEFDVLVALGIPSGQGYYFAKPMAEREVVDWLTGIRKGTPHAQAHSSATFAQVIVKP